MAANDTNSSNIESVVQANANVPENVMPVILPPGTVLPYVLPQADDVEEPFEPISYYAIKESGPFGPLNAEMLKDFLRRKLDRRIISSKDVVLQYTENLGGLSLQLNNLRSRMNQIKSTEKERADFIKERIRIFEKALKDNKPLPVFYPHELRLSKAAEEAFQHIGSQGPLTKDQLLEFIHTGNIPNKPKKELINMLQALRLRINDNLDIEKHKLKLPYERVLKALSDVVEEIMCELPRSSRRQTQGVV